MKIIIYSLFILFILKMELPLTASSSTSHNPPNPAALALGHRPPLPLPPLLADAFVRLQHDHHSETLALLQRQASSFSHTLDELSRGTGPLAHLLPRAPSPTSPPRPCKLCVQSQARVQHAEEQLVQYTLRMADAEKTIASLRKDIAEAQNALSTQAAESCAILEQVCVLVCDIRESTKVSAYACF